MDKVKLIQILSEIQNSIDIIKKNIDNISVLQFYTGKLAIHSKELTAIVVKAK